MSKPDDLPLSERPSVLYRPRLFLDGNTYCALYGDNLMGGCVGFGATPAEAMADFDRCWYQPAPKPLRSKVVPFREPVRD